MLSMQQPKKSHDSRKESCKVTIFDRCHVKGWQWSNQKCTNQTVPLCHKRDPPVSRIAREQPNFLTACRRKQLCRWKVSLTQLSGLYIGVEKELCLSIDQKLSKRSQVGRIKMCRAPLITNVQRHKETYTSRNSSLVFLLQMCSDTQNLMSK